MQIQILGDSHNRTFGVGRNGADGLAQLPSLLDIALLVWVVLMSIENKQ